MPDSKKYYDINGKEIVANPEPSAKKYFDFEGNPLQVGVPQVADPKAGEKFQEGTEEGAPYAARLGANSLPMVGSYFGPEGTIAATMAKTFLRNTWPQVFGEPITDWTDLGVETGKDLLLNNVMPKGIDSIGRQIAGREMANLPILRNFPAVREGAAKEMTRQILGRFQQPETQILEGAANETGIRANIMKGQVKRAMMREQPTDVLEEGPPLQVGPFRLRREHLVHEVGLNPDAPPPRSSTERAFETYQNRQGDNLIGQKLLKLDKEIKEQPVFDPKLGVMVGRDISRSQAYKDVANQALRDVTEVHNWKIAAGPKGIQDLAINKLLTGGFKAADEKLNAIAILNELGGKNREIYEAAIDPTTLHEFRNLVNEIKSQEAGHSITDALVKWSNGKLVWTGIGMTSLFHGGSGALAGGVAGGIALTNRMLSKAMEDPATAQAVVAAMRTSGKAPQAGMINQILQGIFKGGANLATVPEK